MIRSIIAFQKLVSFIILLSDIPWYSRQQNKTEASLAKKLSTVHDHKFDCRI